jgi:putative CocE/NonD family hydrolase
MAPTLERLALGDVDPAADQVMVPMRDGVRLATDVYPPSGGGRRATVLVRLPYDKSARFSFMTSIAPLFTERGYAFVAQDVRGKARSEGETRAFVHEVSDGFDTIDWIASRPWSNGVVGMFGDSYYGFTQWAAAASGHPALRAIVPRVTTTDVGTDWMYHQGVFCLYTMVEWAASTWVDAGLYEGVPDFSVRPLADVVPVAQAGRRSASLDRWRSTRPDDPFWTEGIFGVRDPVAAVSIPVLHSGGWWDVFQRGQLRDHARLAGRPGQHLVMGSTDHFDDELAARGEAVEDILVSEAALARFLPEYVGPALSFFDRYLLGRQQRIERVRWHLANAGWRTADAWPPRGTRELVLHAAGDGVGPDGGALAAAPDAGGRDTTWTHDPADPVPDAVLDAWRPLLAPADERDVGRADVLSFTSEPIGELDLAGPVRVDGAMGEADGGGALMAALLDVSPDGRALRMLQGAAVPVRDGFSIDLGDTGYRVEAGHRVRLDLSASLHPRYLADAGTEVDPWLQTGAARRRVVAVGGTDGLRLRMTILGG